MQGSHARPLTQAERTRGGASTAVPVKGHRAQVSVTPHSGPRLSAPGQARCSQPPCLPTAQRPPRRGPAATRPPGRTCHTGRLLTRPFSPAAGCRYSPFSSPYRNRSRARFTAISTSSSTRISFSPLPRPRPAAGPPDAAEVGVPEVPPGCRDDTLLRRDMAPRQGVPQRPRRVAQEPGAGQQRPRRR